MSEYDNAMADNRYADLTTTRYSISDVFWCREKERVAAGERWRVWPVVRSDASGDRAWLEV
jgi:hypothetical protein